MFQLSTHVPNVMASMPVPQHEVIDYVLYAQKLKDLRTEYQENEVRYETRQAEIKTETQQILHLLNGSVGSTGLSSPPTSIRDHKVEKPRPLDDKLSIAAGRAIVRAMKLRKSVDQCRTEGVNAATATAKRYGQDHLTEENLDMIEKKIKTRFNLY